MPDESVPTASKRYTKATWSQKIDVRTLTMVVVLLLL